MGARARLAGVVSLLALAGCGGRVGSSSASPEADAQPAAGGDATTAWASGSSSGSSSGGGIGSGSSGGSSSSGSGGLDASDEFICVAKTCQSLGYTCGKNSDGCGGIIDCGTCTAPEFCGGGGVNKCGYGGLRPDAGPILCVPRTCGLTANCGADDAGNVCPAGQYCGGGGPSLCGSGSTGSVDGGEGG